MPVRGRYAKGVAKREEILDAALDLFARHGYDRTSVREIARHVDLTQAGLLHHFSSKEELFLEALRRRDDRASEGSGRAHIHSVDHLVEAVQRNAGEQGLVRLFVAMSAESVDDTSQAHSFFVERYRWLVGEIASDVKRHQAAGALAPHLDAETVASILIAAADGLQLQWLLDPAGVDMSGRMRALWDALLAVP